MKHFPVILTLLFSLVVAGCSVASRPTHQVETSSANLARSDTQGAVTVVVEPLSLDRSATTLDFNVSMETHSVDLSMDLAELATLTTNTGRNAPAISWSGPSGGHHVSGKLSFPSSMNDMILLDGASELILTIRDVASPERTFIWEIPE